jgi:hypothetical protein
MIRGLIQSSNGDPCFFYFGLIYDCLEKERKEESGFIWCLSSNGQNVRSGLYPHEKFLNKNRKDDSEGRNP